MYPFSPSSLPNRDDASRFTIEQLIGMCKPKRRCELPPRAPILAALVLLALAHNKASNHKTEISIAFDKMVD